LKGFGILFSISKSKIDDVRLEIMKKIKLFNKKSLKNMFDLFKLNDKK